MRNGSGSCHGDRRRSGRALARRRNPTVALVVAVCAVALFLPAERVVAAGVSVTNLRLADWGYAALDGGRLAVSVAEGGMGKDLNGDEDASDSVVHVYDPAKGTVTNAGVELSSVFLPLDGGRVAFLVSEARQGGMDRNGDGDSSDYVLAVWNPATRMTRNLRLASRHPGVALDGGRLAFVVPETEQGGADKNGDGDTTDSILHVWDPTSDHPLTNLRMAAAASADTLRGLEGGRMAFLAREGKQGRTDLNGDGDAMDGVLHIWDPTTKATQNLRLASNQLRPLPGGGLAVRVPEANQDNLDRNGDGDATDDVIHVWDPVGGIRNLGLARAPSTNFGGLDSGGVVVNVSEESQGGVDLNGDGDVSDKVAHVWEPTTGRTRNLGLASEAYWTALTGGGLTFSVRESAQGGVDRNGDGDSRDRVIHVYDPASATVRNLGLATGFGAYALPGGGFVVPVMEASQGGRDLSGDGDTTDAPLHVWNPDGTTINLGLTASYISPLPDGGVAALVREQYQGGTDLNGDGDAVDEVLHVWSASTGVSTNLALAADGPQPASFGTTLLAFHVSENAQGATDLNGDGDTSDQVIHVAKVGG